MVVGSPIVAQAEIVTWEFPVTLKPSGMFDDALVKAFKPATSGAFTFEPPVTTGPATYNWSFALTTVWAQVENIIWLNTGLTFDDAGTADSLAFDMANELVAEPGVFSANLHLYVSEDGKGHFDFNDLVFDTYNGNQLTGIAVGGWMSVEAVTVPEPSTIALMLVGMGSLGAVIWRRRR